MTYILRAAGTNEWITLTTKPVTS